MSVAAGVEREASADALAAALYPDPILAANLYCRGHLDEVLHRLVWPFWRRIRERREGVGGYLWAVRSPRRGEHFKIRLHGPEKCREPWRLRLAEAADEFFAGRVAVAGSASGETLTPVIDEADRSRQDQEDQRLVFTEQRRSAVILGPGAEHDDTYAAHLSACLGFGGEWACNTPELDGNGRYPYAHRQAALLRVWISALAVGFETARQRREYLAYHRDWAVRYHCLGAGEGDARAARLLQRYAQKADSIPGVLASLRETSQQVLGNEAEAAGDELENAWRRSLGELLARVSGRSDFPSFEPFAEDVRFPVLLKVLHLLSNLVGLNLAQEGSVVHLLLQASFGGSASSFVLMPGSEARSPAKPAGRAPATIEGGEKTPSFNFEKQYSWVEMIASSGEAGQLWQRSYEEYGHPVRNAISEALVALRSRRLEDGRRCLEQAEAKRQALLQDHPTVYHVVGRFFFGSLAFYHFHRAEFDQVDRALDFAAEAIVSAVALASYLLPFAALATDIPLKRTRIARDRRQWQDMQRHGAEFRAMMNDREPLCRLADGRVIGFQTIADHVRSISGLAPQLHPALAFLTDLELRHRVGEGFIERLYRLPGLMIRM